MVHIPLGNCGWSSSTPSNYLGAILLRSPSLRQILVERICPPPSSSSSSSPPFFFFYPTQAFLVGPLPSSKYSSSGCFICSSSSLFFPSLVVVSLVGPLPSATVSSVLEGPAVLWITVNWTQLEMVYIFPKHLPTSGISELLDEKARKVGPKRRAKSEVRPQSLQLHS